MSPAVGPVMTAGERRSFLDRLLGRRARTAVVPSVPAPAPAAPRLRPPAVATAVVAASRPTPRRVHTWASLLQRVRDVTKAAAVVAVDDQGLVIGSHGDLSAADVEDVAAHLALSFDLFERLSMLGTMTESVCAQYVPEGTWLTAIRLRPDGVPPLTVGIVGPHTLVREDRRRVRDAFMLLFDPPADAPASPATAPTDPPVSA